MIEQILDWGNLCAAWDAVAANRGGPGPDQISITRFARLWSAHLHTLADLVRSGRYRPGGLRRVCIPKHGGGQRLLRIPNVGDRVLQRATLNVLEGQFERHFLDCSHGYRPQRGVATALADILALRDRGQVWVLDADVDDCFGSIDHALLLEFLAQSVDDGAVLRLLGHWIKLGCDRRNPARGLALGMPTSPLLCNVYLHRLDWALVRRRWSLVRYADDFVVCCATRAEAEQSLAAVNNILTGLKLRLEPRKTRITSFREGFEFLGIRFEEDTYSFPWHDKRFSVDGPVPPWIRGYLPIGYPE